MQFFPIEKYIKFPNFITLPNHVMVVIKTFLMTMHVNPPPPAPAHICPLLGVRPAKSI